MNAADSYFVDSLQVGLSKSILRFLELPSRFFDSRDARFQIYCQLREAFPTVSQAVRWREQDPKTSTGLTPFDVSILIPKSKNISGDLFDLPVIRGGVEIYYWNGEGNLIPWERIERLRHFHLACGNAGRKFLGLMLVLASQATERELPPVLCLEDGGFFPDEGIVLHVVSCEEKNWLSSLLP